jgi:hypothetical protein
MQLGGFRLLGAESPDERYPPVPPSPYIYVCFEEEYLMLRRNVEGKVTKPTPSVWSDMFIILGKRILWLHGNLILRTQSINLASRLR